MHIAIILNVGCPSLFDSLSLDYIPSHIRYEFTKMHAPKLGSFTFNIIAFSKKNLNDNFCKTVSESSPVKKIQTHKLRLKTPECVTL
jgi:hypothetical protein